MRTLENDLCLSKMPGGTMRKRYQVVRRRRGCGVATWHHWGRGRMQGKVTGGGGTHCHHQSRVWIAIGVETRVTMCWRGGERNGCRMGRNGSMGLSWGRKGKAEKRGEERISE